MLMRALEVSFFSFLFCNLFLPLHFSKTSFAPLSCANQILRWKNKMRSVWDLAVKRAMAKHIWLPDFQCCPQEGFAKVDGFDKG